MHRLIKELFLPKLNNPILKELSDSATINYKERIAFTTDSFVVSPLKFNGGDIGKLAVCGTVNDLVMAAAVPEYLSLALIIEEGLDYGLLESIIDSVSKAARLACVKVVCGDFKVVEKGACDKIFICTSGIGRVIERRKLSLSRIEDGDKIIITGDIGRHGFAVFSGRGKIDAGFVIKSDCAALADLIIPLVKRTNDIKFMRDPTRGGVATTLNEIAQGAGVGIGVEEKQIPVAKEVRAASELLGMDPLYMANEGRAILIVKSGSAKGILARIKKHPLGKNARIIGSVTKQAKGRVILSTLLGTRRILDMLSGEHLPRIC